MWAGSAMHGYYGWEHPRFEDFEYTSWLPDDDTMAWLGNGNTVAELTTVGETTGYMDYTDVAKVLPVATKDYHPFDMMPLTDFSGNGVNGTNGTLKEEQHEALENGVDDRTTPNTALDPKAAETEVAASEEIAPLGAQAVPGNENPLTSRRSETF